MGPQPLGNRNDAEYGSYPFRVLGTRNFGCTDFREFPNRPEIILFQPLRHFRIVASPTSQFDGCDNRVGVPVNGTARSMNPHEMRHGCAGCFAHVSLMVKLCPQFMPRRLSVCSLSSCASSGRGSHFIRCPPVILFQRLSSRLSIRTESTIAKTGVGVFVESHYAQDSVSGHRAVNDLDEGPVAFDSYWVERTSSRAGVARSRAAFQGTLFQQ